MSAGRVSAAPESAGRVTVARGGPILLTGATGQLGSALGSTLAALGPVLTPTRAELDLTDPEAIRRFVRGHAPRWIVNPAAYTAVDRAQTEPALADAINARAVGILGDEAARLGATVVHLSTDYVFPGTGTEPSRETDTTGPVNVYGRSKLAGEALLRASGAAHLILRTSWIYSATGTNFVRTILRLARERDELRVVDDQHGAPTAANDLAELIARILQHSDEHADARTLSGIYHATAAGETTWFGLATEALRLKALREPGVPLARLEPVSSAEYGALAPRPQNSRLDCSKLARTFGLRLRPWAEALAATLPALPSVD